MGKINFTPQVATDNIIGRGKASNSQKRQLQSEPIVYTAGLAYFVPKQYSHEIPSNVEGFANSKRVFAVELRVEANGKLVPTGNLTAIKVSAINQQYYAEVKDDEDAPQIKCELNADNVYRPISAPGYASNVQMRCVTGTKGLRLKDDEIYVASDMLYWPTNEITGYVAKFDQDDRVNFNMMVDEDECLMFNEQRMWLWRTEGAAGKYSSPIEVILQDIVPAKTIDKLKV